MQNAGVGTRLAATLLGAGTVATIPTAMYTFGCMLTGTLLAQAFAQRDRKHQNPTTDGTSETGRPRDQESATGLAEVD